MVANAENASNGLGVTPEAADELLASEVDLLTSGNHIWSKREIGPLPRRARLRACSAPRTTRPAPPAAAARWSRRPTGASSGVVNLEGRVFMKALDDPFPAALAEIAALKAEGCRAILVDFHAEATSEKTAMGHHLDGKVSAVVGTHTHVQTADERLLPGGTAFIADVGMCGPRDSVIGVRKELVLERFLTQRPVTFEPAKKDVWLHGVIIDIDDETGRARSIARVQERVEE